MANRKERENSSKRNTFAIQTLRIKNEFPKSSNLQFLYELNHAGKKHVPPDSFIDETIDFEKSASFEIPIRDKSISYQYRNCTHRIELINTTPENPIKISISPVEPFAPDIPANIYSIVECHEIISGIPTLIYNGGRRVPKTITFHNNLGSLVKISYTINKKKHKPKPIKPSEYKSIKNKYSFNWLIEFNIIKVECPHNETCIKFKKCKIYTTDNKFCKYHFVFQYDGYPIKFRIDDDFNKPLIFNFDGPLPAPEEINLSIEPDSQ